MAATRMPPETVEAQLQRMLDGETFRGAERSRALLRFVVEEALHGRADRLKEYTLGSEALGRGEAFDPRTDPIARVEASRLRSRLDVYYATEGASDPVRISMPKGGYAPLFEWRATSPALRAIQLAPAEPATATALPDTRGRWPAALLGGAAVAIALLAAAGGWLLGRASDVSSPPETWLEMTTPPTTDSVSLAVSLGGGSVVFVATVEGRSRLWIRRLDSPAPRELAGTEDASFPFWAPGGQSIGFFADGRIKRIDLETGLVRGMGTALVPAGATWNRDGVILHPVVPDSPLFRTSPGGPPTLMMQLSDGQTGHRGPAFLPDGRHFLFYAMGRPDVRGVYVGELETGTARHLIDADAPAVFAAPDHILYVQHSRLFARRIDPRTNTLAGAPTPLAEGISADARSGIAAFSASAGTIAYRTGPPVGTRQFVWMDRAGSELSRIGAPETIGPSYGSLSPDGRRLAVQRSVGGNTDIFLVDVDRGVPTQFTTAPQPDIAPVWSPRGDRIVYASVEDGVFQLFEKALDGTPARPLPTGVSPCASRATGACRRGGIPPTVASSSTSRSTVNWLPYPSRSGLTARCRQARPFRSSTPASALCRASACTATPSRPTDSSS